MRTWSAAGIAAAVALSACHGNRVAVTEYQASTGPDWRAFATSDDRARLRNWRASWVKATTAARQADEGAMARDPQLFQPDRGLVGDAVPPAGAYRCRVFKLGTRAGAMSSSFVARPFFECRVEEAGGLTRFSKYTGIQRLAGRIYTDGPARGVFLGALVLGDEKRAMAYGRDTSRNSVGLVERIGPRRWRLALPEPRFESQLDIIELMPLP